MNKNDRHYLFSILAQLKEIQQSIEYGPTLGGEVLADNIDWLSCYLTKHEKKK